MPIDHAILATLCCPVTRSPLRIMTGRELGALNATITQGQARYACGDPVAEALDEALITTDALSVYGIRDGVPVLLPKLRINRSDAIARDNSANPSAMPPDPWLKRWAEISQFWDQVQPPVRPAPQDAALLQRLLDETLTGRDRTAPTVLVLGVTPELATMLWQPGATVLAVDSSEDMIRNVWPAREVPDAVGVNADWLAMPIRDAVCDAIVGDGSVNMLLYPDGYSALAGEVRRILRDDGVFAMRVFARPEHGETLATIFADLRGGRFGNIDVLSWRLATAVQRDLESGCRMGDIADAWDQNVPDPDELMGSLGWPPGAYRPFMDGIRGLDIRMTFPTVRELAAGLAPDFEQVACYVPDYEDGDRYPTVGFKPRLCSSSTSPR